MRHGTWSCRGPHGDLCGQAHDEYGAHWHCDERLGNGWIPERLAESSIPATLYRVRLDSGGYDSHGRYFGVGAPLYRLECWDLMIDEYHREPDREAARETLIQERPYLRIRRSAGKGGK